MTNKAGREIPAGMIALKLRRLAEIAARKARKESTDGRDSRSVTSRTGN
jgi:hypothetical protein